jgi:glyoxylase-like metal-dependent hydrolase (beta-lactamase superfamily II)
MAYVICGSKYEQNRRDFLRTLAAGAASLSLVRAQSTPITATKLADNYIHISGAGSNVLLVTGPDGALLVDGGSPEHSADLLKVASEQAGGRKVQALFNTHWHLESTGSNDALGKSGAKIIAHENTKLWMGTDIICKWRNKTFQPRAKEALPNQTFYTTGKMTFGKEQVVYGYLGQAHTDGDIYVFFPGPNILMTGDVMSVGQYPILDWTTGGWIGGLADASKALLSVSDAQTRIIPGSGPVQGRADLQAQADMCAAVRTSLVLLLRKGMSAKEMLAAAPTKDFDAKWGNPELFVTNAYPGLWGHVREAGGIV